MDTLLAAYRDDDDDDINESATPPPAATTSTDTLKVSETIPQPNHTKDELKTPAFDELSPDEMETSVYGTPQVEDGEEVEDEEQDVEVDVVGLDFPLAEKENELSEVPPEFYGITELPSPAEAIAPSLLQNGDAPPTFTAAAKTGKKPKKKSKDVWTTTTRKGKKKTKHASTSHQQNVDALKENQVLVTPMIRFPDKNDDSPDLKICLSKVYKADKVELSEDRLTAGSTKGYRMVRATRGVSEGAWYFEIKVLFLGETGHTRLGWSMEKADLQAPVGYDENSFAYRDVDGSKVHKALREKYGDEGYKEGDVIGFYINLPDGESYAPDPPRLVWHKSQRYLCAPEAKDDSPKNVPGSEIVYFKNGICQGTAFRDICGGHYYPAASMYTLPNNPSCVVKFNFGPDFERFPEDFGERSIPRPMIEVPYQSYDDRVENGIPWNVTRTYPMLNVVKDEALKILKDDEIID